MFEYQGHNFHLYCAGLLTIHKCQGMTVPEIVVDMSPAKGRFKDGQAYVEFSHIASFNKLHIINYTSEQIHVSKNVEDEMNQEDKHMLPMLPEPMIS